LGEIVATDVLVSRQLKSFQDELATSKIERTAKTERSAPSVARSDASEPLGAVGDVEVHW
jgi:hypothetical protein